jgi:hypothetical protein
MKSTVEPISVEWNRHSTCGVIPREDGESRKPQRHFVEGAVELIYYMNIVFF